ncbi:MAG: hypothetical protein ACOC46_03990, partial [Pirellulales bacterium]
AQGTVPYMYFTTPTYFKEDVWIQAAEAVPGNRRVVHHIIVSAKDPNRSGRREGRGFGDVFLVGTAPGDMPLILPPGVARRVPAGSMLVWQMHYTPTGKVERDRSKIGLVFHKGDQPPRWNSVTRPISNHEFRIPPGDPAHRVESEMVLDRDVKLLGFMPHMHLRGKDFKYTAIYPEGEKEVLLSVPRYDFNWQASYRLAEPKPLPEGTKLHCVAHFDNSGLNPANPDPTEEVRWGDQTWEEMMIGWIDYMYEVRASDSVAKAESQ